MPRKIRQLLKDYRQAGAEIRTGHGKGSHRKITHARFQGAITLSGADGDDAKPYMERALREFLKEIADDDQDDD